LVQFNDSGRLARSSRAFPYGVSRDRRRAPGAARDTTTTGGAERMEDEQMDVNDRIKKQLSDFPVLLYMKGTPDFPQCGFSAQTVAALRAVGAEFAYVNIFEDPEVREGLKTYSNWPTFPQLYVNGELIGGCDIAIELYQSGELEQLVKDARAPEAQ
jgi:monothiol glutaredoxin